MKSVLILALLLASAVHANGGNQKYVDGYLVQLSSLPISPFAGEKFSAIISFANIDGDLLTNVSGEIKIESNGRTIFESSFSAPTGTAKFDYTFNESGYYDIAMDFNIAGGDRTYVPDHFLIEVKKAALPWHTGLIAAVMFLLGISAGFVFGWRIRK